MTTDIRPYRPEDREAIGEVGFAAGFMGESSESFWRDRASSLSIWTDPYLQQEPASTFVATMDGEVVGYLTGILDTESFNGPDATMMDEIARQRLIFKPGVAGFLWRGMLDEWLDRRRGRTPARGELHDPRWPSHLHINLLAKARGTGLGRGLMEAWITRMRAHGSAGCHLGVIAQNTRAVGFFTAMGFAPHGEQTWIPGMRGFTGERLHQQMMVQSFSDPA